MRRFRTPVLLAVSAALLLTAFLAVSELATLRGAKAHDASAFLTRALGPPLDSAPLVRTPARGVSVSIRSDGYHVAKDGAALALAASVTGHAWQAHEHGVQRVTSVGRETIVVGDDSAEEFLTVTRHHGRRTWRWRLDTKLYPRVTPKGVVGFFSGNRLSTLQIEPVAILDSHGRDVTPKGLSWSVSRSGKHTWLELALDDRSLQAPYTIDPTISFRSAGAVATSASGTSISVGIPGGALANDLLLMHVAVRSTTIPSTPNGWNVVSNTNTANNNVSQVVFWRQAGAGDAGTSVNVTIPNAAAVGVVTVYKGVDTSGTPVQQTTASDTANSRDVTCPGLTTNAANEMLVCAASIAVNGTWPASGGGYTREATGAQSTNISLGWYDQFAATLGTAIPAMTFTNVGAAKARNIANTFGLPVDTGAPLSGTITLVNVSPAGIAYIGAGTIYYRGTAAGQFQIQDPFSDTKSALDHVNYPLVSSAGWTHANENPASAPNFTSSNYQWSAGTTTPPSAAERTITEYDAAGNTATQVVPIVNDTTGPQNQTITLTGGAAPYYKTNSVSFTLGDGDDGSGSGIDTSTRTVTRETGTLSGDSCSSFVADAGTFTSPDSAVSSGHCYRYTFTITDRVGNTSSGVTATAKVDGGNPSHGTVTISGVSPAGIAYATGGTVYYRGSAAGSFKLNDPATDTLTAVTSVNYPLVSSAGWTHANESPTTAPNFTSSDYQWIAGTTTPPTAAERTLTATDKATNTSTLVVPIVNDSTAPQNQTITLAGTAAAPNYYKTNSVSFTLGDGDDGSGSGLDTSTRTVTRETASLSGDSCGIFAADAGTYTSPDSAVSSGHCYRYTFTIKDKVGNTSGGVSVTAKVDGGNPSHGTIAISGVSPAGIAYLSGGGTIYYRGSAAGSFKLNDPATDTLTAVASVNYPLVSSAGWTHANENPATAPNFTSSDYQWIAGTTTPPTAAERTLTATDKATNTSTLVVPIVNDSTAPSGQTINLTGANAPYYSSASVSFSLGDGSDSGSGLDTSTRTVTRETGDLSGNGCSNFSADAGTFTSPDTAVSGGHCYRYSFTIKDNVGNASAAVTATAKVDTDAPSISITAPTELTGAGNQYYDSASQTHFFRPGGSGSFTLHATAADGQTGISQVAFPNVSAVSGWTGSTGGADSTSPYSSPVDYAWSSGAAAPGARPITATNGASLDGIATITLAADSSAPSGQTITLTGTAAAPNYYKANSVSFTFGDGNDGAGSGLDNSTRTVTRETAPLAGDSCGTFTADAGTYTSPDTAVSGGHCYRYTFTIADNVGNVSAAVNTTASVDTGDPSVSLTDPGTPVGGTVALSATASDAETAVQQVVFERAPAGGSTWTTIGSDATPPYTVNWNTTSVSDGLYDIRAVATDTVSNSALNLVANRRVDNTAPDTTIDSSPPSPSGNASPTLTFSSSESGSTFECRVDGGSWSSCSSPHTISPALAEGSHTFDVRATDAAGNADSTPASHTWVIDLGAPTVTITAPTTYLNGSDPNSYPVTASTPDTDISRVDFFECSNASADCATGSWLQFGTDNNAPYSATWSTPAFDGPKAIRALAVDLADNSGQQVRTVTIDRTAPSGVTVSYPDGYVVGSFAITTDNGPDPDVNAATGVLERRTGDLTNNSCSSYGGFGASTSPDTLASGKCAQYRYRVADDAGNWASASSAHEAKSDTDAPTSSQADPGAYLRQTVTLTATAGDTGGSGIASVAFQRRPSSGGSWTTVGTDSDSPYSTSFDTTGVSDGLYDFRSVVTDAAGNVETSPAVISSRRIDNTPPSATMLSPGNPVSGTVTLTSNTSDSGGSGIATVSYELAPNGGSFNSQPASWDTTLSPDGLYDLRVTATDVAGNSTTSAQVTTRVDNTPPALTFSSPATGAVVSGTVNLVASSSDASPANPPISFAYKLHSDPPGAYMATGASWNTASLPAGDGLYDLRARATDDAGNPAATENTSIRVDNAPPSVSITAPPAAINGSVPSPTTFSANASDPGGSGVAQVQFFECSNQSTDCAAGVWSPLGAIAAPGPYSVSWPIPGTDGNHALAAVATDNAGHPASAIRNVDVDRNAPNTTIVTKPADPSNDATPAFTFTSSEPGSTFECAVDGGSFAPCTSPHDVTGLNDNTHTFDVRATDPAGNTDATPDTWTWHRDTNAPTGTLNDPGANIRQTVTLTSAENDPPADGYASGLASVAYEYSANGTTWATIGALSAAPFDTILWNTTAVADGVYRLHIVVRDEAGNETTSSAVTNVRIDNTPPTTSQNDPGQYLRATKTLTGSAADSGSGIDHVDFQRAPTGGGAWTTIATDSTPGDGFQVDFDTTSVSDGHYDLRTVAYDAAGNQATSTAVTDRLVDNTPPDATIGNPGAYLRGAVNLTSSTSDPGGANASGVVSVAYEYSTNGGSTWQSTGASFNSTAVPDGNVSLHVVAVDAAGNSTTSSEVTSLVDNTKPVTADDAPSGWQSSTVTVALSASDNSGSGVNVTEYSVDGDPTYTVGTSVVIPAPANGSNDGAHTIAYFSVDNAGNIETVKSATVLIDATPPACPSCSAADYLRGTVTLSASPSESGSGIQSVTFEYADAGGSTWTTIGTDTTGPAPYTVDWDTLPVADGHYDLRIRVRDNANNVTTTNLPDKVVDNTAPDVATVGAPTEGQLVTGTVAITASASDVTSPVASVQFLVRGSVLGTDTTAPWSLSWDTTTGADGAATIQVVVEDMAGNTTTSALRNVSVDNLTPTPALADPGQFLSGTVSLSASSDPDTAQVDFERRPAGGGSWVTIASDTTTPWGTPLDTTTLSDGLYDFRVVATDQTGHTGASPIRSDVRIDNTSPSGSITTPAAGATVGGSSVALGGSYSDGGSGVATVRYELRPTGGGSFTQIASSSSAPFGATWDATTVASGSYDLRPVITDRAGNTFTGPTVTVDVDVTAPTVVLTNPGATISGTVSLAATVSGSGATEVVFGATPAGGAAWTNVGHATSAPWNTSFDTTKLGDGVYDLRAMVSDALGNSSVDVVAGIRIDNTAPRVISSTPADGLTLGAASSISLVTSEAATPVNVTLDGGSTVAPVISGTNITYGTGDLGPGPHTLAGELRDSSGKKSPFRVHFTVWSPSGGSIAPYVEKNTNTSSSTTVDSADGFASATMQSGAWSTSSDDWLVLRIAPMPAPSGLTNGFGPGPEALDVTAWWALAGTQVHEFSQPVSISIRSTDKGLVPATFENGSWRVLSRVPTAGTLPPGWDDGFSTDAGGFHLLTKHLSVFALLHDLEPPQPPQNVRGFLGSNGLTIRWLPGADNSGTYDDVTLFSDSTDVGHYDVDYTTAAVGKWSAADPRVFRLRETDLAGNESPLTRPLRPVPSLIGLTADEAEAALTARGFTLGQLTVGGEGRAATITGPVGLALAEEGSTIDLTIAPGVSALTQLVFKVHTAPKFKPAARKTIAARVSLTRAARVTAELFSPRRVKLYTWRFSVKAGRSIVKLRVPRQVRRSGIYSMRWTARAGRETLSRRITLRLIGSGREATPKPAVPIEVVLTGQATRGVGGKIPKRKPKVVSAAGVEPTFDAAANRSTDVRVIVVDVDEFGLAFLRDLHTVFPSVRIVAVSASPRKLANALKAGAVIALPRSTPPATLAKVIQRLLATPKHKPGRIPHRHLGGERVS